MPEMRYTIDPADFTDTEWGELYYASQITPRRYEFRDDAKPFRRTKKQIRLAIMCAENKAESISLGLLGKEDEPGQDAEWIQSLESAAKKLRLLIGPDRISKRSAKLRLYELLTSDIYTDAPEYSARVEEIHELLPVVFGN